MPRRVTGLTSSPLSSFPLRGQVRGTKDREGACASEMSGWRGRIVIPEAFETKEQKTLEFGDTDMGIESNRRDAQSDFIGKTLRR
jgi:hypothetical protein